MARQLHDRGASWRRRTNRSVSLRRGVGRSITPCFRRDRLQHGRRGRRSDRDGRQRQGPGYGGLRDRGWRHAPALEQWLGLARAIPSRSGSSPADPSRRPCVRHLADRGTRRATTRSGRHPDPRRSARRAWADTLAGDARTRRRGIPRPLSKPARIERLRRGIRQGDPRSLGRGRRLRPSASRRTGRSRAGSPTRSASG